MANEFPMGKESYCPQCYFEDDITILRENCKHNCQACIAEEKYQGKSKLHTCDKRCKQCQLENNSGICNRENCINYKKEA